jgi:hypothetical protein
MAEQFNADSIKPIRWGEVSELPNGHWLTTWTIDLESVDLSQFGSVVDAATDTEAGFSPRLTQTGPTTIAVAVETTRWGMELDYYDLTYRLLSLIDSRLGRIATIQGTPRDWWKPFRSG